MGQQRFTHEFKHEAVRQVIERGHPVAEVAARIGVSSAAETRRIASIYTPLTSLPEIWELRARVPGGT